MYAFVRVCVFGVGGACLQGSSRMGQVQRSISAWTAVPPEFFCLPGATMTKTLIHLFISCTYTSLPWQQCLHTSCTHIKTHSSNSTRPQLQNEINLKMVIYLCSIVTTKFIYTSYKMHLSEPFETILSRKMKDWSFVHRETSSNLLLSYVLWLNSTEKQQHMLQWPVFMWWKKHDAWCLSTRAGIGDSDVCSVSFQQQRLIFSKSYIWTEMKMHRKQEAKMA